MASQENKPECWIDFQQDISYLDCPNQFNFPFYYTPHPLSKIAAEELQKNIIQQKDWNHNFGLPNNPQDVMIIGKMFGVLVVRNTEGELGYLAGFSGKIANSNAHQPFVPPVYDLLQKDSYFLEEEERINEVSDELEAMIQAQVIEKSLQKEADIEQEKLEAIAAFKAQCKANKKIRDEKRINASEEELVQLKQESINDSFALKELQQEWKQKIQAAEEATEALRGQKQALKEKRKSMSGALQRWIFEQYHFHNAEGIEKSLNEIFEDFDGKIPPSGAGECAAPKLLEYAYRHDLEPVCMAEFWWGASPKSEIRKHQQFYPACRGKCEPILGHMLQGLDVEDNPIDKNPAEGRELEISFEDEAIIIVNKPPEFLSVPGKRIKDSVMTRIQEMRPEITGPVIVHRLDMSTSGIMVIAKNEEAHYFLQQQFIKRKVSKRYIALLENEVKEDKGSVDLPLRVDLNNRPHQLVCYEHGKPALTHWEKLKVVNGQTLIAFYPVTGRTHQLRVHAAHADGLNNPIVGDDLYGTKGQRLHLHAAYIKFKHPLTRRNFRFEIESGFE